MGKMSSYNIKTTIGNLYTFGRFIYHQELVTTYDVIDLMQLLYVVT